MSKAYAVAIVGGGAAGLAAGIFCAREIGNGQGIVLLEKGARVGKKLLATGNGTCNLSNQNASPLHYHGTGASLFTKPALAAFSPKTCLEFFASVGVLCDEREAGRNYPLCHQAGAVLDCLRLELTARGVEERCNATVTAIVPQKSDFLLSLADGTAIHAKQVIVAVGGAASPSLGGSADGYALVTALGHHKTPLFPSIVQVQTDITWVRAMKGLRTDATVTFSLNEQPLCSHTGELLFTDYGISGPAVMQISRVVGDWERKRCGELSAVLDLLPAVDDSSLLSLMDQRCSLHRTAADFFTGLLHKRIGQTVCRIAGFSLEQTITHLTLAEQNRLCHAIKHLVLPVRGTQGFSGAQVTAGGIRTDEIDPHTLMSRTVPGLYLIGEVLDVDGDCGGYNLHWAWASAHAAAKAVAHRA